MICAENGTVLFEDFNSTSRGSLWLREYPRRATGEVAPSPRRGRRPLYRLSEMVIVGWEPSFERSGLSVSTCETHSRFGNSRENRNRTN